jgi:hypothetical protein
MCDELPVCGINFADAKDLSMEELLQLHSPCLVPEPTNRFNKNAVAVHCTHGDHDIKIGYIPDEKCHHARTNGWLDVDWGINEIGRFAPRSTYTAEVVYCKIFAKWPYLGYPDTRSPLKQRLQTDDTLYDGATVVSIKYESKPGKPSWRDVVLLQKDEKGFYVRDGARNKKGELIPRKGPLKFEKLKDAQYLPSKQTPPAKRAKVS